MKTESEQEFLISQGGPFYELQRQLGLVSDRSEMVVRRLIIFLALTAFAPLLLELFSRGLDSAVSILLNPDFLTRFVLFVVIAIMMERSIEQSLREFLKRFRESGLLGPDQRKQGAALVARSLRFRNSAIAESVCLVAAFTVSVLSLFSASADNETAALLLNSKTDSSLTPTGWWIMIISNPIFLFLTLRWLWRITIWSIFLHWISRLELRLVVTHPDKSGGIAFIGKYPNAFSPFVFAFSSVIAAIVFRLIDAEGMSVETYGFLMSAWLAIVLVVFLAPLTSFVVPLGRLRETALREADMIDTRTRRENEREVLGKNLMGPPDEPLESEDEAPGDTAAIRKSADALRLRPFSREAVIPLSAAALIPLLIAGTSVLPLKELLNIAKKLLLF